MSAQPPGWHGDPTGRHDARYWNGAEWTEHVSEGGRTLVDALEHVVPIPAVTARPSSAALRRRMREVPIWRYGLAVAAIPVIGLWLYVGIGPLMVWAYGALLLLGVVMVPLYFRLVYISTGPDGLKTRNQVGVVKRVAREDIAAVAVGKVWNGGLTTVDQFIFVSAGGGTAARFYLQNWELDDVKRLAAGLGLPVYGRPGRPLDEYHSGRAARRAATVLGVSALAGCALPFVLLAIFGVAVAVAVLVRHS